MYRKPAYLTVGSDSGCNIVLAAPGVAGTHARIEYDRGFVVANVWAHDLRVDGVPVAADRPLLLTGYEHAVELGGARLDLYDPKLALLYAQPLRTVSKERPYILGSDRTVADVLVDHPSVADAHARVDLGNLTITDLGSNGGVRLGVREGGPLSPGPRLPAQQAVSFAECEGIFLGDAWIPANMLRGEPWERESATSPRTVMMSIQPQGVYKVGRAESCQIRVSFPQVSHEHALVKWRSDGKLTIRDLGSRNGTFVRGRRLGAGEEAVIEPTERVLIGPYPLRLDGSSSRVELDGRIDVEAVEIGVQVRDRRVPGGRATLLDRVTFRAVPGDCIALMGPSGSGKTTLLNALLGGMPLAHGQVRMNGEDVRVIFDMLRGSIGYVPQDDLLHPELTVFEAIRYSARMRLPPDFTAAEIDASVEQTIRDLGLQHRRDEVIGKPEKKTLSGGERKRVNVALELVTDPMVLFLDEPTSGLAADDTTSLIVLLTRLAASKGRTIIVTIHQPAREEYELFNLALILSEGLVTYVGPTGRASYSFFGRRAKELGYPRPVDGPREIFEVMSARVRTLVAAGQTESEAKRTAAQAWHDELLAESNPGRQIAHGDAGPAERVPVPSGARRAGPPRWHQFMLLFSRYATTKWRDRMAWLLTLLQAPIIGLLIAVAFHAQPADGALGQDVRPCEALVDQLERPGRRYCSANVTDEPARIQRDIACFNAYTCFATRAKGERRTFNDQTRAIYFLVIAALWFGISNAAQEIVSERAIFRRERMVNLGIVNYVGSKFVYLALVGLLQCFALVACAYYAPVGLGLGLSARPWVFGGFLFLGTICATAVGLFISTAVATSKAAAAFTPLALIPMVLLGGGVVELTRSQALESLSIAMPSRWAFEGAIGDERAHVPWLSIEYCYPFDDQGKRSSTEQPVTNAAGNEMTSCAVAQATNTHIGYGGLGLETAEKPKVAASALGGMTLAWLALIAAILKLRGRG